MGTQPTIENDPLYSAMKLPDNKVHLIATNEELVVEFEHEEELADGIYLLNRQYLIQYV